MTTYETLAVAVDGRIGRLTLDQPERLNPLGSTALSELARAAEWFDDQGATVVVVTGAGDRAFSAGFDLRELTGGDDARPSSADLGRRMADAIENMEAVAIAAVHGHCIGGGVVLAAACDLRIAADNTRFAIPEVDLGIPLAWGGIPRLVREIGPAMTRELVMTCRPFDAAEAQAMGFVNRVVPRAELEAAATELAEGLAAKAPLVIRATKRQVQTAAEAMATTADGWAGAALIGEARRDPEARDAAARYIAGLGR